MVLKKVIRKGDTTTHGGLVLEGIEEIDVLGKPIACKGHKVKCPTCKGVFSIVEGIENMPIEKKRLPAVEGMKTACGATLIASQDVFQVEH